MIKWVGNGGVIVLDVILDAFIDVLKLIPFLFIAFLILEYIEHKMSKKNSAYLINNRKIGPVVGGLLGAFPQCGFSAMATKFFSSRVITLGTLIAVYLSTSDEMLPLLISNGVNIIVILKIVGIKLIIGIIFGFLIDLIIRKQTIEEVDHIEEEKECHTHHHENTPAHAHLVHPLIHSAKIFAYVFIINLAMGTLIGFVGEENFSNFMMTNRYLAPLFASIIGLIPNCASSILITELFISGNLSFGALFAGLLVNSGLGLMVLLKDKKTIGKAFIILAICFVIANIFGYLTCLVAGF
jgi:hypothetical protein